MNIIGIVGNRTSINGGLQTKSPPPLLPQLLAFAQARRLPCLSDTERAIAIRSLVVATSNARPEQAMDKALSDVLLNRRAHQLMRNGALQR